MRSKILQFVFITWFIISSVFLYNVRIVSANPIVLAPEIYYAIASAMAGGGLYAANEDAVENNVQTYWEQANDTRKHQWAMITAAGMTVGKIMIDGTLMTDVVNYLDDNYHAGQNTVTVPGISQPVNNGIHYVTVASASFVITHNSSGYYVNVYNSLNNNYVGIAGADTLEHAQEIMKLCYFIVHDGVIFSCCPPTYEESAQILLPENAQGTEKGLDYGYTGDAAGFGSAVDSNGGSIAVNIPPIVASTLHRELQDKKLKDWLDKELARLNREGNPSLDDSTQVAEGEQDFDWYDDAPDGDIYKVPKGDPPKEPDDKKFGKPVVPVPIPDLTPNDPTIENPDDTIVEHPPKITTVDNGDGTSTTTTTQDVTKTSTSTDPQTGTKTTTKTTTTTTTKTITDNQTGDIISTETSTETKTGDKTTEDVEKDMDKIDWEPLRRGLGEATNKFPFSLPWDLYRSIKQLESSEWDGIFEIDIDSKLPPGGIHFDIDLRMFEELVQIAKKVELFLFDISLILITRKLMGGDV